MNLFNELTQFGSVMQSTESEDHITFEIRLGRKTFFLAYYFTDSGWDYEITDRFGSVVDNGIYLALY